MTVRLDNESRTEMARIAAGLPTKSAKIRALGLAGIARADIARFLDIRYQHVRNVLLDAEKKERRAAQTEAAGGGPPGQTWAQVGPDGRVVIPAAYRQLLGVEGGGHLFMLLDDGEVRLLSRDGAIARAQALVAPYLKDESSSADAFIAERRREARRETSGG